MWSWLGWIEVGFTLLVSRLLVPFSVGLNISLLPKDAKGVVDTNQSPQVIINAPKKGKKNEQQIAR
jgi:hypothetical protein